MPASPPKMSVGAAWAAWAANGSVSDGSEFFERVSAWSQGTTAQLLRARWRPGARRPSSAELEGRLHHHLEVVAQAGAPYPEALDLARRGLIEEIAGGAFPAPDVDRRVRRPQGRRL